MKKFILSLLYALLIIAGITSTSGASLLNNGDFDDTGVGLSDKGWTVKQSISGWTTTSGPGIEVQRNTVVSAHSGDQYIELDSHNWNNSNTRMEQENIFLTTGSYFLEFYYMPRTDSVNDNGIKFGISEGSSDIFAWEIDAIRSEWTDWKLVSERFSITTEGNYNLYFSAYKKEGTSQIRQRP